MTTLPHLTDAERALLTHAHQATRGSVTASTTEIITLLRSLSAARGALTKYGRHTVNCSRAGKPDCDCGWDALKELR